MVVVENLHVPLVGGARIVSIYDDTGIRLDYVTATKDLRSLWALSERSSIRPGRDEGPRAFHPDPARDAIATVGARLPLRPLLIPARRSLAPLAVAGAADDPNVAAVLLNARSDDGGARLSDGNTADEACRQEGAREGDDHRGLNSIHFGILL